MNEFIEQFLVECRELVELGTANLLALEARPDDREQLDSAFRAFHTLKGAAGIVEFAAMARALHGAEDALETVRGGTRPLTARLVGDCLNALEQVLTWLDRFEATGEAPLDADAEADALIARFGAGSGAPTVSAAAASAEAGAPPGSIEQQILEAQIRMLQAAGPDGLAGRLEAAALVARRVLARLGRPEAAVAAVLAAALDRALREGAAGSLIEALESLSSGGPAIEAAAPEPAVSEPPVPAHAAGAAAEHAVRALRVDVERVDALVRLTGEITVVKTAIGHLGETAEPGADPRLLARLMEQQAILDRLVGELQHTVLGIRVLPLRQVFQRFPRLVRELGVQLSKRVRLVTEGEDAEADKAIVENLFEPLLHVLRNAVGHGIEDEAARLAAGKPPIGTITLRGARQGEAVIIEIEDDGRGIDVDRVRSVAAARGIATPAVLAEMTEAEVIGLVFAPGFSTAAALSDLSGRGVGMDAVRFAVERMGGRATIESRRGRGTVARLVLPFTLMMTRVMTVRAGGQLFGVPFDAMIETVQVARERIVRIGAARAVVIRDRTLPVIGLAEILGAEGVDAVVEDGRATPAATIVVATISGQPVGLEVDGLGERMEVMLKPIGGLLAGMPGISGATILGDGQVLLVLDLQDLVI